MRTFTFRADGLEMSQLRDPDSDRRRRRVRTWSAGVALVVASLYSQQFPGAFEIGAPIADGDTTNARFVDVSGTLDNPSIDVIALRVNGSEQRAGVNAGRFTTRVPLVRGDNTIQALVPGTAGLVTPGSNVLRIRADIPPSDIWSELTWDGVADVDLHLILPNGEDCYYEHTRTAAGAFLDFDNVSRDGPEHIVMDKAVPGTYRMQVVYFSSLGRTTPVTWHVRLRLRDAAETHEFSGVLTTVNEKTEFWTTEWKAE